MRNTLKIATSIALLTGSTWAKEGCFPENDLKFSSKMKSASMSKIEFDQVVKKALDIYSPIIKKKFKKKLIINGEWENDRVNAHATRDDYDNPVISLLGGMARHPEMTKDGLMLIICHELGHQFGGAPKQFRGRSTRRSWSSAEGQADYFSATKCLPKMFQSTQETKLAISLSDESAYEEARKKCKDDICVRIVLSGLSVGRVFASLRSGWEIPKISNLDSYKVSMTEYKHPKPQCRLDTYISGANCENDRDKDFDNVDPKIGACFRAENGYDDTNGARPRCWYHPQSYFK
ncbi:MAG: hypothetical protein KC493_12885 [Bacteriovoracaceae bacterium]|nr:hypothetical protein [Bacteriovoracaceae bacterium]